MNTNEAVNYLKQLNFLPLQNVLKDAVLFNELKIDYQDVLSNAYYNEHYNIEVILIDKNEYPVLQLVKV